MADLDGRSLCGPERLPKSNFRSLHTPPYPQRVLELLPPKYRDKYFALRALQRQNYFANVFRDWLVSIRVQEERERERDVSTRWTDHRELTRDIICILLLKRNMLKRLDISELNIVENIEFKLNSFELYIFPYIHVCNVSLLRESR